MNPGPGQRLEHWQGPRSVLNKITGTKITNLHKTSLNCMITWQKIRVWIVRWIMSRLKKKNPLSFWSWFCSDDGLWVTWQFVSSQLVLSGLTLTLKKTSKVTESRRANGQQPDGSQEEHKAIHSFFHTNKDQWHAAGASQQSSHKACPVWAGVHSSFCLMRTKCRLSATDQSAAPLQDVLMSLSWGKCPC